MVAPCLGAHLRSNRRCTPAAPGAQRLAPSIASICVRMKASALGCGHFDGARPAVLRRRLQRSSGGPFAAWPARAQAPGFHRGRDTPVYAVSRSLEQGRQPVRARFSPSLTADRRPPPPLQSRRTAPRAAGSAGRWLADELFLDHGSSAVAVEHPGRRQPAGDITTASRPLAAECDLTQSKKLRCERRGQLSRLPCGALRRAARVDFDPAAVAGLADEPHGRCPALVETSRPLAEASSGSQGQASRRWRSGRDRIARRLMLDRHRLVGRVGPAGQGTPQSRQPRGIEVPVALTSTYAWL